jgi:predicted hydrolase (HD superfamily)
MPTRDDAWKLLCEYTASESLRKHMLAVEACVRAYARKSGASEELWGIAALLHDFDYEGRAANRIPKRRRRDT